MQQLIPSPTQSGIIDPQSREETGLREHAKRIGPVASRHGTTRANPKSPLPLGIAKSHGRPRQIDRGIAVRARREDEEGEGGGTYGAGASEEAGGDAGRHFAGGGGVGRAVVREKKGRLGWLAERE